MEKILLIQVLTEISIRSPFNKVILCSVIKLSRLQCIENYFGITKNISVCHLREEKKILNDIIQHLTYCLELFSFSTSANYKTFR